MKRVGRRTSGPATSRNSSTRCCRILPGVTGFPSCRSQNFDARHLAAAVPGDEGTLLKRAHANRAIATFTATPTLAQQLQEYGGPDAAAEMVPALAPVDASPAKRSPFERERCGVDPAAEQECPTFPRQEDFVVAPL